MRWEHELSPQRTLSRSPLPALLLAGRTTLTHCCPFPSLLLIGAASPTLQRGQEPERITHHGSNSGAARKVLCPLQPGSVPVTREKLRLVTGNVETLFWRSPYSPSEVEAEETEESQPGGVGFERGV